MNKNVIILVALYRYRNFPVRIMHPLLKNVDGAEPYVIFFKNCDTNEFNFPTEREEGLFAKLIAELSPRLVGFSVLSPYVPIARRLTRIVKDNSSSLVIWGGAHPTISPESCINEADMLCVGEGEGAIIDLAKRLADGESCRAINNLWVKNNGYVIKNPMRSLIQDLDSMPFPSYGDKSYYFIDSNRIAKDDPLLLDNSFWVQASRGCPYSCSYCISGLLQGLFKDIGPYTRRRSVNSVIKEIKENLRLPGNRIDNVFFIDEVFGSEESWLNEFEIRYKKEIKLPFYAAYNPQILNPAILGKLAGAGLYRINFGIQTGSDFIRNKIFRRPGINSEIIDLAKEIDSHGIKIEYDLIMDNPYDTAQSLKGTIEFLLKLPGPLRFNLYSLQYFPNYALTKKAIEDGYIAPKEAEVDTLIGKTTKSWSYAPKLWPYTEKQILQNIIWLMVWNCAKPDIVKFSVFGNSSKSKLCLNYLNLKSVVLGKMLGMGRFVRKNYRATFRKKDSRKRQPSAAIC